VSAAPSAPSLRPALRRPIPLAELSEHLQIRWRNESADAAVTGVTLRAHEVRPGDLFAAVPGSKVHGADFTAAALAAGAAAVLTDPAGLTRPDLATAPVPVLVHPEPRAVLGSVAAEVYGRPSQRLRVLGVTGTSGKTTVSHLIEGGLRAAGRSTGLIGTVLTRIGEQQLPSSFTTPEAPDLQALFAVMADDGVTDVGMEVSSHALAYRRVDGTQFAVAAFTNLSQDHLDFHHDMDDYFTAKARLFDGRARVEVVCVDDAWGPRLVGPDTVTVSAIGAPSAGWHAEDVVVEPDGHQRFVAVDPEGGRTAVRLRLSGLFNVANGLVALASLQAVGVEPGVAAPGFDALTVPGRVEPVDVGQPFRAFVDYAHKPAAVAALLDALRSELAGGRLIVVLGCGGERDASKRPVMGAAAATRAELLVVTDDNPRGEDPAEIRAAMLAGAQAAPGHGDIIEIGDRRAAIAAAVEAAKVGDVVVVAGKGHETGQEVAGVRHPFSDVDELAAAIRRAAS
jgi:UDP-N-acetylmuramoyl-L-alanyl-D-glutamate--2,6-diaminopimelate ligase